VTLVESAGGAFSPLGAGASNVELATALQPALWLLVAPDALGVLHDLRATLGALPRPPDAVVLSSSRGRDESSGSNAAELAQLGIAQVLARFSTGARDAGAVVSWLLAHQTFKSG
jgi:dethiobiotin synthetase